MLKCCLNRKVIVGLAVVAVGVLAIDAHAFTRLLPYLFFAICPLSMLLMMWGMSRSKAGGGVGSCSSMSNASGARGAAIPARAPASELAQLRSELDRLQSEQASTSERRRSGFPSPMPTTATTWPADR